MLNLILIAGLSILSVGCRGTIGPTGISANGVDTVPPTVNLVSPLPLSTQWDTLKVEAWAIDNVAVESVTFTVDGYSLIGSQMLIAGSPPYKFNIPSGTIDPGWHFVAARVYDVAGNITDSPLTPVRFALSKDLSDTLLTLRFHNGVQSRTFMFPDSTFRSTAYWMKFTPPDTCEFVWGYIWLGGSISDSSSLNVAVWSGRGLPQTQVKVDSLGSNIINGAVSRKIIDFPELILLAKRDYFLVISQNRFYPAAGDTVRFGADDGLPPWGASGSRDDDGWQILSERFGTQSNLMMSVDLFFSTVEPDTTGQ